MTTEIVMNFYMFFFSCEADVRFFYCYLLLLWVWVGIAYSFGLFSSLLIYKFVQVLFPNPNQSFGAEGLSKSLSKGQKDGRMRPDINQFFFFIQARVEQKVYSILRFRDYIFISMLKKIKCFTFPLHRCLCTSPGTCHKC